MKKKVWNITVKDNPNRVVMGENDEFYTTDTEAYLVFNLEDKNFNPATAVLTLENRNDGSLKNETVDVVDGLIEWEMPQRYIEHFGNWQGQLVYEDTKDGQPELYTSAPFTFVVNAHIGDKKKPSLVEIENWEKFICEGTELIGGWKEYILELKQRVESGEFDGADGTVRFEEFTADQIESLRGETGRSMEFDWNGTQLGVRIEGQTDYHYIELKGEKGETGKGLEYDWSGTQLGVRKEKDTEFSYVDLKGEKGDAGEIENLDSSHIVDALGYMPISPTDVPDPTWANLQNKPTEFNPTSHIHGINDVTGLRAELDSVPELTKENVGLGNVDNVKQASKVEHNQLATDFSEHQTEVTTQLAQTAYKDEVYLRSSGININDLDEPTRQTFLEAQGIDVNYVLGEGNVEPVNTSYLKVNRLNLVNPSRITPNTTVNQTTGALIQNTSAITSDFIRVEEGKTYRTNGTWHSGYYNGNKEFVRPIVYSGATFTVPVGENIEYVILCFQSIHLESGLVLVEGTRLPDVFVPYSEYSIEIVDREVKKSVFDVVDEKLAHEPITLDQTSFFKSERINLLDSNKLLTGFSVSRTNGNLAAYELSSATDFIRVEEGKTYRRNTTWDSAYYNGDKEFVQGLERFVGEFTVPTGLGIEFVRFSVPNHIIESGVMLVEGTRLPQEFVPYEDIKMKFRSELLKKRFIHEIEQELSPNNLRELKWNVLGDSITQPQYAYHKHIRIKNNMYVENYGIGGTRIAVIEGYENAMCERYVDMDDDADIITVFGGTNDAGGGGVPMGTIDSTDKTTFMGALNVLCAGLIQKYPGKKIGFITPMQRANMNYAKMTDYVNAIKEVCGKYSIPVLDLLNGGGIYPNDEYIKATYIPDGLHPNEEGHKVIARRIEAFIKSL